MIVMYLVLGLAASTMSYVICDERDDYYMKATGFTGKEGKTDRLEADLVKDMQAQTGINVNLNDILQMTKKNVPEMDDIEEDEEDPFITKRDGTLRSKVSPESQHNDWVEDLHSAPVRSVTGGLIRKRRCGGGDDDDDDGDANRSRRSRRIRRVRKKVRKSKSQNPNLGGTVKTVKVIQNGQVVSQTAQYTGPTTTLNHQVPVVQPATVQIHQPGIQTQQVIATSQPQLIQTKPSVVVQQPTVHHTTVQQPIVHHTTVQQPAVHHTTIQQPTVHHVQTPVVHVQQPLIQ